MKAMPSSTCIVDGVQITEKSAPHALIHSAADGTKRAGLDAFTSRFKVTPVTSELRNDPVVNDFNDASPSAQKRHISSTVTPTKNCSRCFRLKKKCLREQPRCTNCIGAYADCVYTERKTRKRKHISGTGSAEKSSDDASKEHHVSTPCQEITVASANASSLKPAQVDPSLIGSETPVTRRTYLHIVPPGRTVVESAAFSPDTETPPNDFENARQYVSGDDIETRLSSCTGTQLEDHALSHPNYACPKVYRRPSTDRAERLRRYATLVDSTHAAKMNALAPHWDSTVTKKYIARSMPASASSVADEFLATKAIGDDGAAIRYVKTFFTTFGHVNKFIDAKAMYTTVRSTDFSAGLIVSVYTYMTLAIGCRLVDQREKTNIFPIYFSNKSVDAVLDMLDYGINSEATPGAARCTMRVLILVILYSMVTGNERLAERLMGIASLLVTQWRYYEQKSRGESSDLFWLIYYLDRIGSLVWARPLFLPRDAFIKCIRPDDSRALYLELARLCGAVLERKLSRDTDSDTDSDTDIIADVQRWHSDATNVQHIDDKTQRSAAIYWASMWRDYLTLDLEQSKGQFVQARVMGFLSSSFALALDEQEIAKNRRIESTRVEYTKLNTLRNEQLNGKVDRVPGAIASQEQTAIARHDGEAAANHSCNDTAMPANDPVDYFILTSLLWHQQACNVVNCTLKRISHAVSHTKMSRLDMSLQLGEISCILQVLANLFSFISDEHKPSWMSVASSVIHQLGKHLLQTNIIACSDAELLKIAAEVQIAQSDINTSRQKLTTLDDHNS